MKHVHSIEHRLREQRRNPTLAKGVANANNPSVPTAATAMMGANVYPMGHNSKAAFVNMRVATCRTSKWGRLQASSTTLGQGSTHLAS